MQSPNLFALQQDRPTIADISRQQFEERVKRYARQLTTGCGSTACANRFCSSCPSFLRSTRGRLVGTEAFSGDSLKMLAIHLAALPQSHFCPERAGSRAPGVEAPAREGSRPVRSLLHRIFSAGPFASLFESKSAPIPVEAAMTPFAATPSVTTTSAGTPRMLSVPVLVGLLDRVRLVGDYRELVAALYGVFAVPRRLGMSFLTPSGAQIGRSAFGDEEPFGGVDLRAVRHAYSILASVKHYQVQATFNNAIDILLTELAVTHEDGDAERSLRALLIALEYPRLESPTCHSLTRVFAVVDALSPTSRSTMRGWLADHDRDSLLRLTRIAQGYVARHMVLHEEGMMLVAAAVRFLELVHEANGMPACRRLTTTDFYISALLTLVDYRVDYENWHTALTGPQPKTPKMGEWREARSKATFGFSFCFYPFLLPAEAKSRIMHIDAMMQMSQVFEDALVRSTWVNTAARLLQNSQSSHEELIRQIQSATNPYLLLEVRRSNILRDTISQLEERLEELKKPLRIRFSGEEGFDQGGLQKEFFQLVVPAFLDEDLGLFTSMPETPFVWFAVGTGEQTRLYEMFGLVIGLAMYNGVILDVRFPPSLYRLLLARPIVREDLAELMPVVHGTLTTISAAEDVADMGLTFEVPHGAATHELCEGGAGVAVTMANRDAFVAAYADWLLHGSVRAQSDAMRAGFSRVAGGEVLKLCEPDELDLMICGSPDIDFAEWKATTRYLNGYDAEHPVIKNFWTVVSELSLAQKKKLLMFVTSCDRVPIKGFSSLKFTIQRVGASHRLPTSHTCFNILDLPEYPSIGILRDRLVIAIENAKGFGFA